MHADSHPNHRARGWLHLPARAGLPEIQGVTAAGVGEGDRRSEAEVR